MDARKARSFADLGELKKALQRQAEEAARQEAQRRAAEERERRERELFARTVGPVTALKDTGRAEIARPRPVPAPLQRRLDEEAVLREAISDEFDVESLLETDEALSYRRPGIGPDVVKRLRRGDWVIQRQVDLHGLRRDEARERLAEFLREAVKQGLRCVRVIHGKGLNSEGVPVLKNLCDRLLRQRGDVLAFHSAPPAQGGTGAVLVLLRPRRTG